MPTRRWRVRLDLPALFLNSSRAFFACKPSLRRISTYKFFPSHIISMVAQMSRNSTLKLGSVFPCPSSNMMASPGVASVMMDAAQALLLQGNAAVPPSQTAGSTSSNHGLHHPNASSCVTGAPASTSHVEEGRGRTVSAENEMMETDTNDGCGVSATHAETGTSCAGTIPTAAGHPPTSAYNSSSRGGDFASSDALDALAALASATSEVRNASVDEEDDDDDALHEEERHDTLGPLITSRSPSPEQIKSSSSFGSASRPRRMMGRLRSVSNPEGMEKWDSMGRSNMAVDHSATSHRLHFVLPSSILEEELADAQMAVDRGLGRRYRAYSGQFSDDPHHHPYVEDEPDYMDAAPLRISPDMSAEATLDETEESEDEEEEGSGDEEDGEEEGEGAAKVEEEEEEEEEEEDTSNLSPEELLRRARARLLEDVSTANGGPAGTSVASRGVLPLPHSLGKYKNVYNKNGRIGIYTPAERAAIIARFQSKRARRNWKKKIRYGCRKSLADRRIRVKGRFVKRDFVAPPTPEEGEAPTPPSKSTEGQTTTEGGEAPTPADANSHLEARSDEESKKSVEFSPDTEMTDADAGNSSGPEEPMFDQPTEEQPYRRTRRHTFA